MKVSPLTTGLLAGGNLADAIMRYRTLIVMVCTIVTLAMALGGLAYGSLVILLFHAAFHVKGHLLWRFKWFRRLVRRHDIHHWTRANYGILFFGLDRLFGTLRDDFPAEKQEIF